MMTFSACLWTGLFPLLQCGTYAHITKDKWTFMMILSGITLICCIGDAAMLRARNRAAGRPWRFPKSSRGFILVLIIALLLAVRMVISCAVSPLGWDLCWKGASTRNEGLQTQLVYIGLFILFAFSRVRTRPILISAAVGVLLFTFVVCLQRVGINALNLYPAGRSIITNYEFQGTIGNIDMDVGYLSVMAALFLTEIVSLLTGKKRRDSVLYLDLLLTALIAAVYLIFTMTVQFGVIALGVLVLITLVTLLPKKLRLPALILFWAGAFCVIWFWDREGGGVWEIHEILHGRTQLSFGSNRIVVWMYSLMLVFQSPFVGGGSDTFVVRFNQFIQEMGLGIPNQQGNPGDPGYIPNLPTYFDNPHNEYIAHLINHGFAAMLLFMALIAAVVMVSLRKKADPVTETDKKSAARRRALPPFTAAVIIYAVQAFFSFSVPMLAPLLFVMMGICIAKSKPAVTSDR